MTIEEIKEAYSMSDILERYGMQPNRAGFCKCPFHIGDRTPSMKIYEKDFHCFACGANGDIFNFIQRMDDLGFKEAFLSLGGTYDKPSFSSRLTVYRAQKAREQRQKAQERLANQKTLNNMLISIYREYMAKSEPLSDTWCDCYNALQYQLYLHGELNKIPY